ncbi:MAG: hypothetical protein M3Z32_07010 [Acidobacteriota bacterium]|nr:hypothetical protein [Acidobacteriota bacterium]
MKATAKSATNDSPEVRLKGFIDKFDPEVAGQIRSVRNALRKRLPGAVELIYDNYIFFVIGYGPNERASEVVLSIARAGQRRLDLFYRRCLHMLGGFSIRNKGWKNGIADRTLFSTE